MVRSITINDIRDLLMGFVASIELDQIRVDALPARIFHRHYSDSLWRMWRHDHVEYVNLLLSTVDAISPVVLEKLTWIATSYEPEIVYEAALELFALAVSGQYSREDVATAAVFFEWLIEDVTGKCDSQPIGDDAPALMKRWLAVTDPLRITQDLECGYGMPSGCVN
jgi:hypothetical protein